MTGEKKYSTPIRPVDGSEPAFYLTKVQRDEVKEWSSKHNREKHMVSEETVRYAGAIGGAYTYEFTPTSIGVAVSVKCSCGEEIDVSHYEDW